MDENAQNPLKMVPMKSLSLRLARPVIRMHHGPKWKVDKLNPTHDIIICLSGKADYIMGEERFSLTPGEAMLIPSHTRFRGTHGGQGAYRGFAQHFSLDLFGRGDLLAQMRLRSKVSYNNWDELEPLAHMYHDSSSLDSISLSQQHLFMVLLLAYVEQGFLGWNTEDHTSEPQDQLSMHIMIVASRLSADPLGAGVEEATANVPYNEDYFRRAFKERIGMTPQKYREQKRMEFAVQRLSRGLSVKEVAAELGYTDPYFFSRMFKRHIGASPSAYRLKRGEVYDDPPHRVHKP